MDQIVLLMASVFMDINIKRINVVHKVVAMSGPFGRH